MPRSFLFITAFLLIYPFYLFSHQNINPSEKSQKSLAGQAIFPEKEYKEWLEVQKNQDVDPASKIKCSVNIFFILKYETLVRGKLLDFGFLFDESYDRSIKTYTYEIGLMYYRLEAWRLLNSLLKYYEYRPKFDQLLIDGTDATVNIWARAGIVRTNYPYSVESGLYGHYTFKIEEVDGLWLIHEAECSDEMHDGNPPGTNFISRVEEMKKRHEYEKSLKPPQKAKKKIPSIKELQDTRKIELYHEIFGHYRFVMDKKNLLITFFTEDKRLFGNYEGISKIPLFQFNDDPLEFEWRPEAPWDKIYKLRFIRDRTGKITRCIMEVEEQSYEGIKSEGPCHLHRF